MTPRPRSCENRSAPLEQPKLRIVLNSRNTPIMRFLIGLALAAGLIAHSTLVAAEPPPIFLLKWGTMGSADGEFNEPRAVTVDSDGNVYVADYRNHRV